MNMLKIFATLTLFAACTSTSNNEPSGEYLTEMCGAPPAFPGLAVAFARTDGNLMAVMTTDTYGDLVKYRLDALAWQDCVLGIPSTR